MNLLKLILYFFLFYIIIRTVRLIIKYINMSKNKIKDREGDPSLKSSSFDKSRYRDIQDAEFTEIKPDNKSQNDSKQI